MDDPRQARRQSSTRERRPDRTVVPWVRTPPPAGSVILMTTRIAGVRYHAAADGELPIDAGSLIELRAEPENPYDARAVAIHLPAGERIGYIPRRKNTITARLLAQEVDVFGRVERVDRSGAGLELDVSVLLPVATAG